MGEISQSSPKKAQDGRPFHDSKDHEEALLERPPIAGDDKVYSETVRNKNGQKLRSCGVRERFGQNWLYK